jgi:Outer membrane lipoprotein-sorting protein
MKNLLFIVILLSVAFSSFAQNDAKAKELLDKSSEAFTRAGGIEAEFTLKIKDVINNVTEAFDGLILLKGNKFFIETPEYAIFFDGKTQWLYNKAFDEVNISEPNEKEIQALSPASIYTIYKKGSDYKYLGEKTDIKMRKVQEIELVTKNRKEDIGKVIVQLDKTSLMPLMFHIYFNNNMENQVHINRYKSGQTIPDAAFSFDKTKHPQTEIIDLR